MKSDQVLWDDFRAANYGASWYKIEVQPGMRIDQSYYDFFYNREIGKFFISRGAQPAYYFERKDIAAQFKMMFT